MSEEGEKATVAGDEVRVELASDKDVDIKNRDPEQINQHLKVKHHTGWASRHVHVWWV